MYLITAGYSGGDKYNSHLENANSLNRFTVTRLHLSGQYYNANRKGILFKSESSKTSKYITITTSSGKDTIFSSSVIDEDVTIMSVMNRDYILTQKGNYLVRREKKDIILKALEHKISPSHFHRYLDGSYDAKKTSLVDLSKLVQSEEAQLIQGAALELGRRGMKGLDSTAVMAFYVLAMRLATFQPFTPPQGDTPLHDCKGDANISTKHSKKRQFLSGELWACKNNGEYCDTCPIGGDCAGMCGPKCQCWKMVCGNCCYHHGCFGQDVSCRRASLNCFRVFGFKCD